MADTVGVAPTVYVMCGLPFGGKSTLAALLAEHLLTQEVALRFGYPLEELTLYKAAYAIATSNAYDPEGRDGHFVWCVQLLQREAVRGLLTA